MPAASGRECALSDQAAALRGYSSLADAGKCGAVVGAIHGWFRRYTYTVVIMVLKLKQIYEV
jgi:hypothetical protein